MMPFIPLLENVTKEQAVKIQLTKRAFKKAKFLFEENLFSMYTPELKIDITPIKDSYEISVSVFDELTRSVHPNHTQEDSKAIVKESFKFLDKFCKNEFTQECIKSGIYISKFFDETCVKNNSFWYAGIDLQISNIENFKKEEKTWTTYEIKEQAKIFKKFGIEQIEEEIIDIAYSIDYDLFVKNYVNTGFYEITDYNVTFTPGAAINDLNVNELTEMIIKYLKRDHKHITILDRNE